MWAKVILLISFFLLISCSSLKWYEKEPYYCLEWVWDDAGVMIVRGYKIRPSEVAYWESEYKLNKCGKVTGPYKPLKKQYE